MTLLEETRAQRNTSKALFEARLGKVRAEIEERGLGGRIADKASADARHVVDSAMDIANNSKGIIAATLGALAVWFLRNPIMALADRLMACDEDRELDEAEPAELAEEG